MSEARRTFGAVVLNDKGQLLPYTCRSTVSQCEEAAANDEFFPPGVWGKLKGMGAKVVPIEIVEVVSSSEAVGEVAAS